MEAMPRPVKPAPAPSRSRQFAEAEALRLGDVAARMDGLQLPEAWQPLYEVRCDDCKTFLNHTRSLSRSAAGGQCRPCAEA